MPVAAAIAGAAVIGGVTSVVAGNKAANAAKDSSAAQIAESRRQYDQSRADYAPYRETGTAALSKLASMYGVGGAPITDGGFTASPGYEFRRDEALRAGERAASARGSLASGGTKKALARYTDGLASSEYENYANRLASLAGIGQSATGATTAAGANASGQIVGAIGQAGQARASSYANTASAINNTATNLASLYLYNQNGGFSPVAYPGAR